jgi:UDP-2,3-diacylglucosamine pyrophosphatase LpxH
MHEIAGFTEVVLPVEVDTVIISDLHLGSEVSLAEGACRMLQARRFRRLILLGDIFCDLNFRRLKKEHWKFLSYIRKLSNPKRNVEVVWVEGNHDRGLTDVMSHLVGVPVYQEYAWTFAGERYLAIHGDQFDRFVLNNAALSAIGAFVFIQVQKLDSKRKGFSRFLDRLNSQWLRLSPKVAAGALAHAKLRGADVVFCGHTHQAMQSEKEGIRYFNSGCWVNQIPAYITVDETGVQIHDYAAESAAAGVAEVLTGTGDELDRVAGSQWLGGVPQHADPSGWGD